MGQNREMNTGYIKLWRSLLSNGFLMSDKNAYVVFTILLLVVDRRTATFTTGRYALGELCNINPSTVRDVLKRLERENLIEVTPDYSKSKIRICNWEHYQGQPATSPSNARSTDDTKQEERKRSNLYIASKSETELLSLLNQITKRSFRVLPKSAKATVQKFSVDEIKTALGKMMNDPWHKTKADVLSSDYMLRVSTIDKFLSANDTATKFEKSFGAPTERVKPDNLNLSRKQLAAMEYKS
jgi:hypothetical protein